MFCGKELLSFLGGRHMSWVNGIGGLTYHPGILAIPKKDTIFRFEVPLPEDDDNDGDDIHDANEMQVEEGRKQDDTAEKTTEKQKNKKKPLVFELHGNQFQVRAADRANKKFKWKTMDYI